MIDHVYGRNVFSDAAGTMTGSANRPQPASLQEKAAERVICELDWASPKRPGRGVPPPRSGLPLLGVP